MYFIYADKVEEEDDDKQEEEEDENDDDDYGDDNDSVDGVCVSMCVMNYEMEG